MNALFAFDDPAAARRVHDRLLALGWPEDDLVLQGDATRPHGEAVSEADELATGGMVRSLQHLLQGLFDGDAVEQDTSAYTQTLQRGGAVLRVRAATPAQQERVDAAVRDAGCTRRTGWSEPPSR